MSTSLLRWTLAGVLSLLCLCGGAVELSYRWKLGRWLTYGVATRVLSRDSEFAVEVINGTLAPQLLETMPDRSFQGIACRGSVFYRATLEQWDRGQQRWMFVRELSPLDALKQDQIPSGNADRMRLWPGRSVCAGWFPQYLLDGALNGETLRVVLLRRFTVGRADSANQIVAIASVHASDRRR